MLSRVLPLLGLKKRLSFEELQSVQSIADQVVLCMEQTMRLPGNEKKKLAVKVASSLLKDSGILCPESLVDTAIEASVRVMNLLEKRALSGEKG